MAPNTSSSVYNEAPAPQPTDAPVVPASATENTLCEQSSVAVPAVMSESSSNGTSGVSSSSTMSSTTVSSVDSSALPASDSDVNSSRYSRVSPVFSENVAAAAISIRKSCLKRSSSVLPSPVFKTHDEIKCEEKVVEPPAGSLQKNRRRCWECKVKIGLAAVQCRCGYKFCGKHRYAEEHSCEFNFKSAGKRKLEEENPRVVPMKVARIN